MTKLLLLLSILFPLTVLAQISGGSSKSDGSGTITMTPNTGIGVSSAGVAKALPEVGYNTDTNGNVTIAWQDDLKEGIYDPRDPRFAGGIFGRTPWLAAQAVENRMACDLSMGVVQEATAKWPQGAFVVDQLLLAPGSHNIGQGQSDGGTTLLSRYNNHFSVLAPITMTLTCSDGQQHTDSAGFTRVSFFQLALFQQIGDPAYLFGRRRRFVCKSD
jgi:hypothetical protein